MPEEREYEHPPTIQCTLVDGDIPAGIARDIEVIAAIAAHALNAAAHHTKTTDASELVAGNLPAARLGGILTTHGDIMFRGAAVAQRLAAGVSGLFLQTKGAAADPVWAAAGGIELDMNQGITRTLFGNDTVRSTKSVVYFELKESTLEDWAKDTFTTYFELKSQYGASVAYGKVYKDNGAIGIERIVVGNVWVAFSEDLDFTGAATYEVYVHSEFSHIWSYVRYQRIIGEIKTATSTPGK